MTQDQFFVWAERQAARYEFDGSAPVAMTGGTLDHSRITGNILAMLHGLLRGTGCTPFGPDAGVRTVGHAVRYPDVVVTCSRTDGRAHTIEAPVVVFEVLSPGSDRLDRIDKLREYQSVASIRRYLIVEQDSMAMTAYTRQPDNAWQAAVLTENDSLELPELGLTVPVAACYDGVEFGRSEAP